MRAVIIGLLVAGCGRIGFAPAVAAGGSSDGGGGGGDAPGDTAVTTGVRSTLALDQLDPGETLADFPLLVILDDTRADRTRMAADASDVRFFDETGALLPHEIEQVGSASGPPLIAWVRVPAITGTTTTLSVTYGAPPVPASTTPVWSTDYVAVWHLDDASDAHDSTGRFDAVATGTTSVAGVIGGGRKLTAAQGDHLVVADTSSFAETGFTLSGWVRPASSTTGYEGMITRQYGVGGDNDLYLGIYGANAVTTCETAAGESDTVGGTTTVGSWMHVVGTADGTAGRLYVGGVQVGTLGLPGPLVTDLHPIFIGADRSDNTGPTTAPGGDYVDGDLDELRIENVVRTPAWIAYDDAAERDAVITYGAAQEP